MFDEALSTKKCKAERNNGAHDHASLQHDRAAVLERWHDCASSPVAQIRVFFGLYKGAFFSSFQGRPLC